MNPSRRRFLKQTVSLAVASAFPLPLPTKGTWYVSGVTTNRWSCASPNFSNIPKSAAGIEALGVTSLEVAQRIATFHRDLENSLCRTFINRDYGDQELKIVSFMDPLNNWQKVTVRVP